MRRGDHGLANRAGKWGGQVSELSCTALVGRREQTALVSLMGGVLLVLKNRRNLLRLLASRRINAPSFGDQPCFLAGCSCHFHRPCLAQLIFSFFTNLNRSSAKQLASAQNTLKAANKQKQLFTRLSDKLLFQQAAAVPNRVID
jgi:hypothetical protein